jgi:hypothetical protein
MEGGEQEKKSDKQVNILKGLQLPTKPAKKAAFKTKEIVLKPVLTNDQIKAREGSYFSDKDIQTLIEEDSDIYGLDPETGEKKLLAKFRKNVIPHDIIQKGWESYYITAAASRNRGAAAGPIQTKSAYWRKRKPTEIQGWSARYIQDGKVSKMRVNNNVFSSVLGYFEQTPFMGLPCRLTSYTQKYFKYYKNGIPFIQAINDVFKELVPDRYKAQKKAADEKPMYRIADTCFSSVTVNRNFRTALHMDDGDFKQGYGNLSVIERGKYHGGYTLFPRYGVGFNLRTGDFIAMDVHEWHCNTDLYETKEDKEYNKKLPKIYFDDPSTGTLGGEKPFTRISFVCYLREKLRGCKDSETRKYYKSIHFDPEKGPKLSATQTRKKKRMERETERQEE